MKNVVIRSSTYFLISLFTAYLYAQEVGGVAEQPLTPEVAKPTVTPNAQQNQVKQQTTQQPTEGATPQQAPTPDNTAVSKRTTAAPTAAPSAQSMIKPRVPAASQPGATTQQPSSVPSSASPSGAPTAEAPSPGSPTAPATAAPTTQQPNPNVQPATTPTPQPTQGEQPPTQTSEKPSKETPASAPATSETAKPAQEVPQAPPAAPAVVPEDKAAKEQEAKEEKQEAQEDKKQTKKTTPTLEEEGIDTLEQEGGNWLLKRQALEKTIDVIEKIKDVFTKTLESRIDYLVKRNKIDRSFDLFSNAIGFELGDLNQLLSRLVTQLKEERTKEGDLTEEERTLLADVESKIKELKDLKSILKSITDMDASLDDSIMQVENEINVSNSYQTRAWRNFQMIKKVLNDEKAEELYLQTESLLKNMQDILTYLKGDLLTYFNSVIESLTQDMDKVKEKIKELTSKGINLQDEAKKIRKAEKLARKGKTPQTEEEKKKAEEKEAAAKKAQKPVATSWFDYVAMVWRYPLSLVTSSWDYVMSFFVVKKVEPTVRASQVAEKQKKEQSQQKVGEQKKIEQEKKMNMEKVASDEAKKRKVQTIK